MHFSAGYFLEGDEHLVLDYFGFVTIGYSEVVELVDEVKSLLVWGVQLDSTVHDQHILLREDYSIETCRILEAFNPNFVVYDRCGGVG